MNTHNLCCIGHITLDKIVTPKRTLHMPGGTSFYFAHGMSKLDTSDFLLVTALAVSEMDAVEEIRRKGIDVKVLPVPIPSILKIHMARTRTTGRSGYWQKPIRSQLKGYRMSMPASIIWEVCWRTIFL